VRLDGHARVRAAPSGSSAGGSIDVDGAWPSPSSWLRAPLGRSIDLTPRAARMYVRALTNDCCCCPPRTSHPAGLGALLASLSCRVRAYMLFIDLTHSTGQAAGPHTLGLSDRSASIIYPVLFIHISPIAREDSDSARISPR